LGADGKGPGRSERTLPPGKPMIAKRFTVKVREDWYCRDPFQTSETKYPKGP